MSSVAPRTLGAYFPQATEDEFLETKRRYAEALLLLAPPPTPLYSAPSTLCFFSSRGATRFSSRR